jgi:hypothetical protein
MMTSPFTPLRAHLLDGFLHAGRGHHDHRHVDGIGNVFHRRVGFGAVNEFVAGVDREDLPVEFVLEQIDEDLPADAAGARGGADHRNRARLEDGVERMHAKSYFCGGFLRTSSYQLLHQHIELVADAAEGRERSSDRIVDIPVEGAAAKRARHQLFGAARRHRHHDIHVGQGNLGESLGARARDVDLELAQDLDGVLADHTGGVGTRAVDLDQLSAGVACHAFRHRRTAHVADADKENACFTAGRKHV